MSTPIAGFGIATHGGQSDLALNCAARRAGRYELVSAWSTRRRTSALAAHSPESCASEMATMCSMCDSRRLANWLPS